MDWQPIETAPSDETWIIGRNTEGVEARIQSRQTHPSAPDLRHWAIGEESKEGSWLVSKCFYPIEWHPCSALKACPFCAASATAYVAFPGSDYPWHVGVDHGETCPMRITDSHCYADGDELTAAWNQRSLTPEGGPK